MRLSPSDDWRAKRFIVLPGFYNVLQPSGSLSRKEQLELGPGFDQTTEM
jgi:hypothetical protein